MLDRPSCVTVAGNNKKEKKKKKKSERRKKEHTSHRWSKPLAFRNQFNFALVERVPHKINRNGGKKLQINGVSLDTDGGEIRFHRQRCQWNRFVQLIPLQNRRKLSLLITWRIIETIVGPFFLHSLYFDPNSLFREGRGIKCQTSLILLGRCRDNLFTR